MGSGAGEEKKETAENEVYILEFEGIYKNSTVFINGHQAGGRPYGYTGFFVDLTPYLYPEEENILTVTVDNSKLPNSRWYTGGGIYRPVWLWTGKREHIACQGVQITTRSIDPVRVQVQVSLEAEDKTILIASDFRLQVQLFYQGSLVASQETADLSQPVSTLDFELSEAHLWSAETPELYQCVVML